MEAEKRSARKMARDKKGNVERTQRDLWARNCRQLGIKQRDPNTLLAIVICAAIVLLLLVGPVCDCMAQENRDIDPYSFEFVPYEKHLEEVEAFVIDWHKNVKAKFRNKALALVPLIVEKSLANGVDPLFVANLIKIESNFQKNAISRKGAIGLMQVMCCRGHCKDLDMRKANDQILAGMRLWNEANWECNTFKGALNFYCTGDCKKKSRVAKDYWDTYQKAIQKYRR